MNKKVKYSEPKGYFPKEVKKKYGIGEYAPKDSTKKSVKKVKR